MTFRLIILLILGGLYFNAYGQFGGDQNCFSNIFIDRPMTKSDTIAIIKNRISKIKLFEKSSDDTSSHKIFLGQWELVITNSKIQSTQWKSNTDSNFYLNNYSYILLGCYPLTNRQFYNKKIIDTIASITYSDGRFSKYQFTHHLDQFGKIIKTENLILGYMFEDRYSFEFINYKYDKEFQVESHYKERYERRKYFTRYSLFYQYEK